MENQAKRVAELEALLTQIKFVMESYAQLQPKTDFGRIAETCVRNINKVLRKENNVTESR